MSLEFLRKMTWKYGWFGIPSSVGEFVERAKRNGIKEVNLMYEPYTKPAGFRDAICFETLVLDGGRKFLKRNLLTVLSYSFYICDPKESGDERTEERRKQREKKAAEIERQLKEMGLEVHVDLKVPSQRKTKI